MGVAINSHMVTYVLRSVDMHRLLKGEMLDLGRLPVVPPLIPTSHLREHATNYQGASDYDDASCVQPASHPEGLSLRAVNARLRFYCYGVGGFLRPHTDWPRNMGWSR